MSYDSSLLSSSALMRVRLTIGDTDPDDEYLSDGEVNYFISISDSETEASIKSAKAILVNWTKFARERSGQVEIYGRERFENYRKWLQDFISSPSLSSLVPIPLAGGIDVDDFRKTELDKDNIGVNVGWKNENPTDDDDEYLLDNYHRFY